MRRLAVMVSLSNNYEMLRIVSFYLFVLEHYFLDSFVSSISLSFTSLWPL